MLSLQILNFKQVLLYLPKGLDKGCCLNKLSAELLQNEMLNTNLGVRERIMFSDFSATQGLLITKIKIFVERSKTFSNNTNPNTKQTPSQNIKSIKIIYTLLN